MEFPLEEVRSQFPSLQLRDNDASRVYLDNPAGTQVPARVADAVRDAMLDSCANLGGAFPTSVAAGEIWEDAHSAMADFLGAASSDEIVIGPNMTSLTYQFSRALGREWGPGDEIVCTRMDHEGNVGPWMQLAESCGATCRFVHFSTESWQVEPDDLRAVVNERTRLVALGYASNLTGSVNQIRELARIARECGALVYVDAVQFAPHRAIDVRALDCDFLVCSAYKFFGPHLGVLWGRRDVLDRIVPYKLRCSTDDLPGRLETGTPQIELMAGLTACISYLAGIAAASEPTNRRDALLRSFELAQQHEERLATALLDGLGKIDGVQIAGITNPNRIGSRVPTVSFTIEGVRPARLVELMSADNIFLWAGHNYAWEVVHQLGIPPEDGVVRIGIAHYNTAFEIDATLDSIRRNLKRIRS